MGSTGQAQRSCRKEQLKTPTGQTGWIKKLSAEQEFKGLMTGHRANLAYLSDSEIRFIRLFF